MKTRAFFLLIYALLILSGGIIGYIKSQSVASIVMGLTFAIALLASAYTMMKGIQIGFYIASTLTLILSIFFTYRLIMSHKFMPSGLMCILSLVMLAILSFGREDQGA